MYSLSLLTTNSKLDKSNKRFQNVLNVGLAMAPHNRSGHNVCPAAGYCSAVCLAWFSGRTVTSTVRNAMLKRTQWLFSEPVSFHKALDRELLLLERRADRQGKTAYCRLNVASDLDWSRTVERFPRIRFYDYTKVRSRVQKAIDGRWPSNYSLTLSYNEKLDQNTMRAALWAGLNVSVVFDTEYCPQAKRIGKLPRSFQRFPVIDGDTHDLRHPDSDGRGRIIGLRFKGSRRLLEQAIKRRFVVSAS